MINKIPVKIVQIQDIHGTKDTGVMLDFNYYFESKDNSNKKVEEFKKLYDKVIEEIKYLFYGKDDQKKYRNLPSSLYYKLATIINQFNQKIENDFFITNYDEALHRDFGLSKDYIYDLRIIANIFKQNEIIDCVPFSYYRALMRKKNLFDKYNRFNDEKKRLNEMGKNDMLPGRENYKREINQILEKLKQRENINHIINFDHLSNILQENYNKTSKVMAEVFKKISSPTIHNNYISIMGIKFDPSITVYPNARAEEIIDGWKFLINKHMPVDVYVNASIIHLLHNNLLNKFKNIPVNQETEITIENEPEILEILRFCYWVNKSRNIINNENFEKKFTEIRKDLKCKDELDISKKYGKLFTDIGKVLQDETIDYEKRLKIANKFYNELNQFRKTISSFLPEFMLPCIIKDEGFDIKFNPAGKSKDYDLLFNSYPAEIKTIVDESKYGKKIEKNLKEEIEITLQRDKSVGKINYSLSQGAEIVFLFLTFSSLGVEFLKHTYKKQNFFSVNRALTDSISLAKDNRNKQEVKEIPVIVFTSSIDTINYNYKIFSLSVPYPVKNNKNKLEANPDNLSVWLNYN